ncbi:MAG: CPBP family intramembrane metalloprotease [Alphaproteobacteria bacterium]|nr:CPBP family intramembrane metalloprotease [Alphaproteobacteria bacterium]
MNKNKIALIAGGTLLLFLVWGAGVNAVLRELAPDIDMLAKMLISKGSLAMVMLAAMWRFGGLSYFGMTRGKDWWFMVPALPFILMTLMVLMNPEAAFGLPATAMMGWALVALAVGISEEAMFRGILWRAVEDRGLLVTSLVTSLLFGAVHLSGLMTDIPAEIILSQAVFAAGVGMMFAAVRQVGGSLLAPIFFHWIFDAAAIIAAGGVRELFDDTMSPARLLVPGMIFFIWGLGAILLIRRRQRLQQSAVN